MNQSGVKLNRGILTAVYLYLVLPVFIFFIGWCKWYIGIPAAALLVFGVWKCIKEHKPEKRAKHVFTAEEKVKVGIILLIIALWVIMSGVGGYVWQNSDHEVRNGIFNAMVSQKWAMIGEIPVNDGVQQRGLVYYIGFWLPAAVIGKLFGVQAGYAAQYLWAAAGILLVYAMICIWQKKVAVWPLFILIFFSGLDIVGELIWKLDGVKLFGEAHLEAWSWYHQFSSNTTQLFWVFNQAVPAWVASAFLLLYEKPKNMVFMVSTVLLSAAFPTVGLLPFAVYFMITRAQWTTENKSIGKLLAEAWKNWASVQNCIVGMLVFALTSVYLADNYALRESLLKSLSGMSGAKIAALAGIALAAILLCVLIVSTGLKKGFGRFKKVGMLLLGLIVFMQVYRLNYNDWQSHGFWWVNLTFFYFLEAGVYFLCLHSFVKEKVLFWLNAVLLYIIPTIYVGNSCDFCMRASIPGLFLIMLWCIQYLNENRDKWKRGLLIAILVVGAVTPIHEFKRTYVNTRNYYELTAIDDDTLYRSRNFSGLTNKFFWEYIAK